MPKSQEASDPEAEGAPGSMWVVVKIMVPFWVPTIIRHLLFRVPKKGAQGLGFRVRLESLGLT